MLDRDTFTHVQTNAIGTTRLAQQISLVSSFYAQGFMFDDFVEIPGHMDRTLKSGVFTKIVTSIAC